jgi:RHS repeat-associated protein
MRTNPISIDAQNRLISATNGGTTETFKYDGLNRQVSRKIGTNADIYSVWDGWNLIEEIQSGSVTAAYLSGVGGLVKNLVSGNYYYQDASGSTSHLASSTGQLLEWYRYDLQGTPVFYNASNTQLSTSNYSIRHLFTGQQWHKELGLYDLRNRFYSPDLGRFLQPDPIGHAGDAGNIYRYCGNNPVKWSDPLGLAGGDHVIWRPVEVKGTSVGPDGLPEWVEGALDWGPLDQVLYFYFYGADKGRPVGGSGDRGGSGGKGSGVGAPFDNGGSDAVWVEQRVLVTGWLNPIDGAFWFGPGQALGFSDLESNIFGLGVMTGYGANIGLSTWTATRASSVSNLTRARDLLSTPGGLIAAGGREFASYNLTPFANAMDKYVGWYAAGGVAAPVVGYYGLLGVNSYLMNPGAWIAFIGGAVPG